MKRSLTLIMFLAMMLVVAACGGSDAGRSERADPVEPRRAQAESDQQSAPEETAREEAARKEAARKEAARKGAPANDEDAQGEQGSTEEVDESSGLSVTTLQGEQVNLGGQGDVTALYFMAGW